MAARGAANLLGGRAIRRKLFGLASADIGKEFDPNRAVNHVYLPPHYVRNNPAQLIRCDAFLGSLGGDNVHKLVKFFCRGE
jgi:hypothetical protein